MAPLVQVPKCPHTKPRLSPNDYGSIVSVTVGSAKAQFFLHKGLLTYYSSYFRAALGKNWKGGKDNAVSLPEDNPEMFKLFFQWIYSGSLYDVHRSNGKIPLGYQLICETYVFGAARIIPELCHACVDVLWQLIRHERTFPAPPLQYIYRNTTPNSALRTFIVFDAAKMFDWATLDNDRKKYPQDFLADVLLKLYETKSPPGGMGKVAFVKETKLCDFHDHSDPAKQSNR